MQGCGLASRVSLALFLSGALTCAGLAPCAAQTTSQPPDTPESNQGDTQTNTRTKPPPRRPGLFARRQPLPPIKSLTIATWSIPKQPRAARPRRLDSAPQRPWRNTFGAEWRSPAWRWLGPANLDADIIVLQGISDVSTVRHLFKAGSHYLIVSRQILVKPPKLSGITGIAIRRRRGLALTGFQHIWWRPAKYPIPPADAVAALPAAITAVRLRVGARQVWIASIAAGAGCRVAGPDRTETTNQPKVAADDLRCQGINGLRQRLKIWFDQQTAANDLLVFAGTGALSEVVDLPGSQTDASAEQAECGPRTPQLKWSRRQGPAPSNAPQSKPPRGKPSLGSPRRAQKRKCALIASIDLDQQKSDP